MTPRDLIRCAAIVTLAGVLSANAAGLYAFTQPDWAVTSTLNGMAGPNGLPSTAWFEWGETTAYGQTTAAVEVGASTGVVRVSAVLSNLIQGKVHHARLVVSRAKSTCKVEGRTKQSGPPLSATRRLGAP
jgi:hypothetical protein